MTDSELLDLAARFGTPLYIFDARRAARRVELLRAVLPDRVELCYAIKANPFVLPHIAPLVSRLEVCSPGELAICDACGTDRAAIVVSGVHKDADLMRELVAATEVPGRFTIESRTQLELLHAVAAEAGRRIPALVRLSSGNQFGVDAAEVRAIVEERERYPYLDLRGIQLFSGTQKLSARRVARELERLDALALALEQECGWRAEELEFGPGLPVSYFAGDAFDEDALLAALARAIDGMRFAGSIVLELGRSLVASCGTFLTRVVDTKVNRGQRYAIVDGGIHHLVYFGQSMAMHQPPCHLLAGSDRRMESTGDLASTDPVEAPWNICGSLCSVNDILAKQLPIAGLRAGSVLAFENAGAYCMTEGISLFLSRDLPAVIMLDMAGAPELARAATPTHPLNTPRVPLP